MKSGLIVYLTGGAELPEGLDLLSQCREMGFTADRVELVGSNKGFWKWMMPGFTCLPRGMGISNSWWPRRIKTACRRFTPRYG